MSEQNSAAYVARQPSRIIRSEIYGCGISLIELGNNQFSTIDTQDEPIVAPYPWRVVSRYVCAYAGKAEGQSLSVRMHRLIIDAPDDSDVDHINGNTFDNRRLNLRLCTSRENMANQRRYKIGSSKYKGVTWSTLAQKWRAQIAANLNFDREDDSVYQQRLKELKQKWQEKLWGEEDDVILRESIGKMLNIDIALRLGRSIGSVQSRLQKLKLHNPFYNNSRLENLER